MFVIMLSMYKCPWLIVFQGFEIVRCLDVWIWQMSRPVLNVKDLCSAYEYWWGTIRFVERAAALLAGFLVFSQGKLLMTAVFCFQGSKASPVGGAWCDVIQSSAVSWARQIGLLGWNAASYGELSTLLAVSLTGQIICEVETVDFKCSVSAGCLPAEYWGLLDAWSFFRDDSLSTLRELSRALSFFLKSVSLTVQGIVLTRQATVLTSGGHFHLCWDVTTLSLFVCIHGNLFFFFLQLWALLLLPFNIIKKQRHICCREICLFIRL